jgi:hypothetical protein
MHSRMSELLEHLEANRERLRVAADRVPMADRERKPADTRWSVAETLEHLAIIEARIAGLLSKLVASARAAGLQQDKETTSIVDSGVLPMVHDRTRRIETPDTGRPSGKLSAGEAWIALEASREQLIGLIAAADGLDLAQLSHVHPALGPLNGYQWIAFVGHHEARHAAQIDEILEIL